MSAAVDNRIRVGLIDRIKRMTRPYSAHLCTNKFERQLLIQALERDMEISELTADQVIQ